VLRRKSSKAKKKSPKPKKDKKKKAGPSKREGVVVKKAETDIYTGMLIISLAAILVACMMLWLELKTFGDFPQWRP